MEFHFLAVIGDQIGCSSTAGIAPERHEIAFVIVAGKKVGKVTINVSLGIGVRLCLRQLYAQTAHPFIVFRRRFQSRQLLDRAVKLGFDSLPFLVCDSCQNCFHLRQQVTVEECLNLARLHIHDSVEAKIKVAAIKLEHLSQQGF